MYTMSHPQSDPGQGPTPVDPIDQTELVARCLSDNDFAASMLDLFAAVTPQQVSELRAAFGLRQTAEALRLAHTIKGAAANLAATGLREVAGEMERLLRLNRLDDAALIHPLLDAQLRRCLAQVPIIKARLATG